VSVLLTASSRGLYQEWIELDLFHDGLARFTDSEFEAAGLGTEARSLIEFMADQETSHATLLTNMLGERAPAECYYDYPYQTVRECKFS
jgi:rubrerythrin